MIKYACSDGSKVSQATIDARLREAYAATVNVAHISTGMTMIIQSVRSDVKSYTNLN